jgi:hypothetical protein
MSRDGDLVELLRRELREISHHRATIVRLNYRSIDMVVHSLKCHLNWWLKYRRHLLAHDPARLHPPSGVVESLEVRLDGGWRST